MKNPQELSQQKVGEIVLANPNAMRVFTKFGIDFCCGGKLTLEVACNKRKLQLSDVEQALVEAAIAAEAPDTLEDPQNWALDRLADHIVGKHHAFVAEQTPEILRLLDKVSKRHGPEHPELYEMNSIFQAVAGELAQHMKKEELILFPAIKRLALVDRGEAVYQTPPFGSVANPINMMEMEHESAGGGLDQIRTLANNFTLPEGACMSYWQVYQLLDAYEKDLHVHVHLENNILFPKAIILESQLTQMQHV
ncbi:MAG: iron-sulfur cluster repair di-iron protein [Bacteroidia bacterium]|nr:iron-sulfur cluster repair di-iron protein [Bacteroidota bacterium]MBP6641164.1 iron-sulfur cluster repair di-iron protein [Bacteroidia bacterium]MBP6721846.1 iron-sulfur cluster repair di-iron protein [Bacteroidia bacterium]